MSVRTSLSNLSDNTYFCLYKQFFQVSFSKTIQMFVLLASLANFADFLANFAIVFFKNKSIALLAF